ncbi:MAG: ABC transporter ATP-binding protein [Desulfobulbus sp.]|nr:MAG: ABC transporter ATP-binding protein [Desulfobulbus sp.]RUM39465.1 MAG: ABC transporter ATP-binding protein [Desulfobulbus sp.]
MNEPAITVNNLSKQYVLGGEVDPHKTFREMLTGLVREPLHRLRKIQGSSARQETFWALKDISFEVQPGEVLGIIGRNGAGKSTLLKILSRITAPTSGEIEYRGRLASLLEVGTGFHPELSGRENIFINGAILGMTRAEIRKKFDAIVDFAGIEQFLDTPVKRYSSGMYVRLAFAVAAHLDPDILVVDEVLAVGDAEFQKKCLGKMKEVSGQGRTVLFVSHNMGMIESLCPESLLLDNGKLVLYGTTDAVISRYVSELPQTGQNSWNSERPGTGWVRIVNIVLRMSGKKVHTIQTGQDVEFQIFYQCQRELDEIGFRIEIATSFGETLYWLSTDFSDSGVRQPPRKGSLVCRLSMLSLMPGNYRVNLYCGTAGQLADKITNAFSFDVIAGDFFGAGKLPPPGTVHVLAPHEWQEVTE